MKRRMLSIICALALCLGLLPGTAWAADSVSYVEYSWNEGTSTLTSKTESVTEYTTVSSSDTAWTDGWYVVSGSVSNTRDITVTVSGTVNLILPAGSSLTLSYGRISINDNSTLNIYGQETGSGTLTLGGYGRQTSSGIGLGSSGSALNIHGGAVNATGRCYTSVGAAPGIDVGTGTLTVYGGEVTAEAGTYSNVGYGAGIRVVTGGTVNIHGGTVTATGASNKSANGYSGAGIGGNGSNGGSSAGETCGNVTITGGTVTATGGSGGSGASAGIGGGQGGTISNQGGGGNVTITGGTVTANGGKASRGGNVQAPGIGGAVYLSSSGGAGTFSTGTNGSAVITTTGGISDNDDTSSWQGIIDNTVYGSVTLPDSLKTLNKDLTVPSGATLILPDGTTTKGTITVESGGTLTVDGTVTNSGTITNNGTLTGGGTINNQGSGTVTGNTGSGVTITYPSTVTVTSEPSGTAGPNQSVTFTATVTGNDTAGTPTGTVQFKDNGNNLGNPVDLSNGAATYTAANGLDIGEHTITAEYNGDTTYTGNSASLTFTVVGDVANISVKTQPTKMEYETGDTLNLSGLVITVHYDDTDYTSEVTWGQDSGITADPANGTALYASQHNGKPVTITYEEKTATTGALTVSKATPTVTAPTAKTLTYDGTDQALVTAGGTTGGTMQYSTEENGNYSTAIPTGTNAGQYTVYYKVVGNDDYNDVAAQSVSVTIAKANAQVTAAPQAVTGLTYTGNPQALVTAGTTTGGTLVYSLDENGEYTDTIPTGTAAQSYTVWYKVQGNANYNDTEAQSVTAVIGNALAEVTILPTANTLTYTGSAQALVTAGEADGGEIQYSLSNSGDFSEQIPTGTNAGDYTVWYYVKGDESHSDTDPVEVKITIAKATPAYTVPTDLTATYGDTLADVALPDDWAWDDAVTTSVGNVGDNTFAAIFTPSDTDNYNTVTKNLTVAVSAKGITNAVITLGDALTYTGQQQTQQITGVTVGGMDVTCTVTGNTGTDAGTYTLIITGTGNFTGTATKEWTIAKANYNGATDVSGTVLANWPGEVTLPAIPDGASYGAASTTEDLTGLSIEGSVLSYTGGSGVTKGREYKITVPVDGGKNYEDYTITVTLTGTVKQPQTVTISGQPGSVVYGDSFTLTASAPGSGAVSWSASGCASVDSNGKVTINGTGTFTVTATVAEDDTYAAASNSVTLTAGKKTLTITADSKSAYVGDSAPALTYTVTGLVGSDTLTTAPTLSYASTPDMSKAGEVQILISGAEAGDNYAITYVPGTLTITTRPSSSGGGGGSSGGGSSNTTTETTKNPDGSTTTIVTNKTTGTVTETTKFPDGSKEVVETKKDGTVTTTTTDTAGNKTQVVENTDGTKETTITNKDGSSSATTVDETGKTQAEVKLPAAVVEDAQGEAVTLPMPEVPITTDRETAPTVTVDLPSGTSAKVEIPVAEVTPGTVAVIVKADGTEEVIKTSLTTENGVAVTLSDGDTVKVVDNSKTFDDVADNYWGAEAVDFTSSRELFAGTSATTFAPDTAMTRAMIVTVLARFEGVDTTTGSTWYEAGQQWAMQNGVSDGSNMDASLTREQLVTMFYRYAQSKGYDTTQGGMAIREYADFEQISDYAVEAMTWAVNTGIINGTSSTTLSPQGPATRAQVATILMRFIEMI